MRSEPPSIPERARIETALKRVAAARGAREDDATLGRWVSWVKRLQCSRFELQYQDLLAHPHFCHAARFFLEDLYAPRDFSKRDAQFARISSAIERLFPRDVAQTATLMANLHALSEELDNSVASELARAGGTASAASYQLAWRACAHAAARRQQLSEVVVLGQRMQMLTQRFGLRAALSLMRGPARAAGLSDLQGFLERGFDAFVAIGEPQTFLDCIRNREHAFLDAMDGEASRGSEAALSTLARAASQTASPD